MSKEFEQMLEMERMIQQASAQNAEINLRQRLEQLKEAMRVWFTAGFLAGSAFVLAIAWLLI